VETFGNLVEIRTFHITNKSKKPPLRATFVIPLYQCHLTTHTSGDLRNYLLKINLSK